MTIPDKYKLNEPDIYGHYGYKGKVEANLGVMLFADKKEEITYLTGTLGKIVHDKQGRQKGYLGGNMYPVSLEDFIIRLSNFFDNKCSIALPYTNQSLKKPNFLEGNKVVSLASDMYESVTNLDFITGSIDAESQLELIKNHFINSLDLDSRLSDLKKAVYIAQKSAITSSIPVKKCPVIHIISFESGEQKFCDDFRDYRVKGGHFKGKTLVSLKEELETKFVNTIYNSYFNILPVYNLSGWCG